ncbi:MAG: hypothetical protein H0U49_11075 [Parachlamydiaceae bacterium]|nr:hypothetical protein [Parachlamydiaceae bacterium]
MWARHFEIFLAIWLTLGWLIFRYPEDASLLMFHDFFIAAIISTISLLSYKYRYIHLLNIFTALWLIAIVFVSNTNISNAPFQNYMLIGLTLLIFAIIPPRASSPPKEWEDFIEKKLGSIKESNQ